MESGLNFVLLWNCFEYTNIESLMFEKKTVLTSKDVCESVICNNLDTQFFCDAFLSDPLCGDIIQKTVLATAKVFNL